MRRIPPIVYYTVLRLLAFAVPLAVFLLIGFHPIMATVIAALIGLCVSIVFLRQPRAAVSEGLYRVRHGKAQPSRDDEEAEDQAIENGAAEAAGPADASRAAQERHTADAHGEPGASGASRPPLGRE